MSGLPLTPNCFRAEMARHQLTRAVICTPINMHPNLFSMYISGERSMSPESSHNIGWAINTVTGLPIFNVDMSKGVLPMERKHFRRALAGQSNPSVRLPVAPRRGRRRR